MEYNYEYDVHLTVRFSDREFAIITEELSKNAEVKYVTEHGGFWYGFMGRKEFMQREGGELKEGDPIEVTLSTQQIDRYILKVLEWPTPLKSLYRDNQEEISTLYSDLYNAAIKASEKREKLNSSKKSDLSMSS